MNILVTGGAGFLGQHLISTLVGRGDAVRLLDISTDQGPRVARPGVEAYSGDIRDSASLVAPMQGVEAVIHLAAMSAVWRPMKDYHAVNVVGTENVCRAALAAGVKRLVHISSWTVYGMGLRQPAHEESPLTPLKEPYSVTKVLGDRLVQRLIRDEGLPAVIIRPDTIFGPGDRVHVGRMGDRLRAGKSIIVGSGRNTLPFVYVDDVVQGLLLALDHPRAVGEVYNIASDAPLSQEEVLCAIADGLDVEHPRLRLPYGMLYAAASAAEYAARMVHSKRKPILTRLGVGIFGAHNPHSIDKARRELGFSPAVSVRDGLQVAAEWYRQVYLPGGRAVTAAKAR